MVLLQLMLPKFRPHPAKESCRPGYPVHEIAPLGQDSKLRADSDGRIYAQNGSSSCDFRVKIQRDTHSIRPWVTRSEKSGQGRDNHNDIVMLLNS